MAPSFISLEIEAVPSVFTETTFSRTVKRMAICMGMAPPPGMENCPLMSYVAWYVRTVPATSLYCRRAARAASALPTMSIASTSIRNVVRISVSFRPG
ncbi:MAG: hypothetical protein BWY76_03346 [bacterium ADurb.Bin429]|nr:MAG: hypothetical protein BWY76_03346 [bacterium ADurb.Bin429]